VPKKSMQKERKTQIFEALHSCLLTKSYRGISTRELAAIAQVNQGILYYFFKDKEDILLQYIDYLLEGYEKRFLDWVSHKAVSGQSDPALLQEAHEFITKEITLNREISIIFIELWSIAGSNARVKERLNTLYRQWEDLMTIFLVQYGLEKGIAKKISSGIIAFCEGIAVCLAVMEKDIREIRGIVDWFKDQVVRDVEYHKAGCKDAKPSGM